MQTYDIVISCVQFLQKTGRAPATTQNNKGLFCWIVRKLFTRRPVLLGDVVEQSTATNDCDKGYTSNNLQECPPS